MSELKVLTWGEYLDEIEEMYSNILQKFSIKEPFTIVGISRGGLIPLTILASRFQKKKVDVISIDSYDETSKKSVGLNFHFSSLKLENLENRILVIDDLIDSGTTILGVLEHIIKIKPDCKITVAVLYINRNTPMPKNNLIVNQVKDPGTWIQFPYEV